MQPIFLHAGSIVAGVEPEHTIALGAALLLPVALLLLMRLRRSSAATPHSGVARLIAAHDTAPLTTRVTAALLALTGIAHLALAFGVGAHAGGRAVLLGLNGVAFLALTVAVFVARRWRLPAALLLTATLLAYVITLAARAEHVDDFGLAVKLVEVTALGLVLVPPGQRTQRRRLGATGAIVALGLATAAVAAGVTLNHGPKDLASVRPEQWAAAERLVSQTRTAIAPYQDPAVARAAGYRESLPGLNLGQAHWEHPRYAKDRAVLDPAQPEQLVYLEGAAGPMLVGAVFVMPKAGREGPLIGGAWTRWHSHDVCVGPLPPLLLSLVTPFGGCPGLSLGITTQEMIHVWTVDGVADPFAEELDKEIVRRLTSTPAVTERRGQAAGR